eukprot:scaffold9484_cov124-Isochrysis_galbana.AAC.11
MTVATRGTMCDTIRSSHDPRSRHAAQSTLGPRAQQHPFRCGATAPHAYAYLCSMIPVTAPGASFGPEFSCKTIFLLRSAPASSAFFYLLAPFLYVSRSVSFLSSLARLLNQAAAVNASAP